jgi:hypothetical protein
MFIFKFTSFSQIKQQPPVVGHPQHRRLLLTNKGSNATTCGETTSLLTHQMNNSHIPRSANCTPKHQLDPSEHSSPTKKNGPHHRRKSNEQRASLKSNDKMNIGTENGEKVTAKRVATVTTSAGGMTTARI